MVDRREEINSNDLFVFKNKLTSLCHYRMPNQGAFPHLEIIYNLFPLISLIQIWLNVRYLVFLRRQRQLPNTQSIIRYLWGANLRINLYTFFFNFSHTFKEQYYLINQNVMQQNQLFDRFLSYLIWFWSLDQQQGCIDCASAGCAGRTHPCKNCLKY